MAKKTFTFIKVETGGKLIIKAKSEKAAREKMHLDPAIWQHVMPPLTVIDNPPNDG